MIPYMPLTAPTEALTEEIRVQMARKKIKQAVVAKHLNISQSSMSRRLIGASPFTVDELYRLADLFGIDPRDLLPDVPEAASA
jgi:transcriptional regulator with XRE-family HTH domain